MRRDKFILSTIWPVWSFIGFLRSGRIERYYPYLLFFFVFYGSLLVAPEAGDAKRHFMHFQSFSSWEWSDLWRTLGNIMSLRSTEYTDFYLPISNFLISRISTNSAFYFAFHALVYGLVYLAALRLVLRQISLKRNWMLYVVFILLVFAAPIAKIQYVRFFLALWLYVLGVLLIIVDGKRFGLIFLVLATMVHFSFVIPGVLFFLYWPLRNRLILWFAIALFAFVSNNVLASYSGDILRIAQKQTGGAFTSKAKGYVGNKQYIEQRGNRFESRKWYTKYGIYMANALSFLLLLAFISFITKRIIFSDTSKWLFSLTLFSLAVSEFGFAFASVGERFQQLFMVLALIFLLKLFSQWPTMLLRIGFTLALPAFGVFLAMSLREMLVLADLFTIFGNPYVAYFADGQSALFFLE